MYTAVYLFWLYLNDTYNNITKILNNIVYYENLTRAYKLLI